jgi:hypothetical protein
MEVGGVRRAEMGGDFETSADFLKLVDERYELQHSRQQVQWDSRHVSSMSKGVI